MPICKTTPRVSCRIWFHFLGGGGTLHNYSFFIGEGRIVLKTCKDLVSLGGGGGLGYATPEFFLKFDNHVLITSNQSGGNCWGEIANTEADGQAWGAGACFPRKF